MPMIAYLLPAAIAAGSLGAPASSQRPPAEPETSLCAADERDFFAASAKDGTGQVSLCGSATLDGEDAWLQYRQSAGEGPILAYPQEREGSLSVFEYSRYTRPMTTYLRLRFSHAGMDFELGQNYDEGAESASLSIAIDGQDPGTRQMLEVPLAMLDESLSLMQLEDYISTCDYLTDDCLAP